MGLGFFRAALILGLIFSLVDVAPAAQIKIATLAPEGSDWMKTLRAGSKEVAQKTQKRVEFKFYPGGVMGNDRAVLQKIRVGQLHGGAVTTGSLAKFYSDAEIYKLPLKFRSFQEVDYVRKRMDPLILEGLERGGMVSFGVVEGGFAYVMTSKPILTLDDLQNCKVWLPEDDTIALETLKILGIDPIPLSLGDVRAGLQTGLIDTVASPPIGAIALQWHTQVKYLVNLPFLYISGTLAVNRKPFLKFSNEDQKVVREVMGRVSQQMDRQNRDSNIKAREALRQQGIQFIDLPPATVQVLQVKAIEVTGRLIEKGVLSRQVVDLLEEYLKEYRSQSGS
jgi:TRAP-type C4-dicarboxylate transport system substrate-binding protein